MADMLELLPAGAWDSHVHVVDEDRFPLHPSHPYRPEKAAVTTLEQFHRQHGIAHACLVAISVYHTDPSSVLDALAYFEGRCRAVVCIDLAKTTDLQLKELHDAGVRGIRFNLRTRREKLDLEAIKTAADRLRPFRWVLQIYLALEQIAELAPLVPDLGIDIVVDHLASPDPALGEGCAQPGYNEFLSLLQKGLLWTKLSGTYRFADLPDLDNYIINILRTAPDRVVWASDWPHTGGIEANRYGDQTHTQPYRTIDDTEWITRCQKWCRAAGGENWEAFSRKIWVENPRRLWRYDCDI